MGYYDPRDPEIVAKHIHEQLLRHWEKADVCASKPKLVVIQGDPLTDRGISAITPRVADLLNVPRGLIVLDEDIADYHSPNADRSNVILEHRYRELASVLEPNDLSLLEARIDNLLASKNEKRGALGKPPLKDYYQDFARLQEVTKAACYKICGDLTVAHTAKTISEFSVTSFYEAGLDLGLVKREHMVAYAVEDALDFEKNDKR